ncbi:hypothetical protein JL722_2001 [Aureococcus anophagefferens]|nr:hypothetical protein JL722_2001 [Aureococcus anophagefferens]
MSAGSRFACDQILSFAGAAGSTCYWINAREINADVGDAIDFVPGSNVTLVSGTIKRDCDPAAESLLVTDWTSTSNDQRYFKLPAYSLGAATDYELAATAADVEAGTNVTSTATISVGRAEVVAVIAGGSRVLPLAGVVELSASESYDEDIDDAFGADAGLSFAWACNDPACDAALNSAASGDAESVSLQGTDIGVGSFVVSLNATAADGRSGTARVTYELVDGDPPAVAIESSVGARVAASTKVILYGAASPSSLGNDATLQFGSVDGVASMSFFVARPPSSGKLVASPSRGFALETQFTLDTHSWVTEDAPLQYAFKTRALSANATTESTLRAPTREGSLADVVLPEGSPNVTLVVVASDALGGSAEATTSAAVAPTGLAGAALANLTTGLLDEAFSLGSGEGVCQTVVAAATAASGDVALTSTMIDAVGSVLPASLAGDGSYDASLAEYTSDPYAGENRGPAVTSSVTRFGLSTSSSDEASSRRRARRRALAAANATVGAGGPSAIVALVIAGGIAGRPKPPGANLTCACGFTGNVSFTCPDNTTIDHACDGLPGVEAVTCPATEDACASWNSSSQAWLAQCETVQGAGGTTTCECGVDTAGDAPPLDYSTKEEKTDAGSVYFKNLTEPPDLSRAVVMIYALLALLLACVAAHAYGLRLDARDAAAARAASAVAAASDAEDDPYEGHDDHDVLTAGWKRNFLTGMDLGHPFYGWYTLYSASVPRPFRAWCCGFEILVFMYALAFETNLLFPDVEEECAARLTRETCASLKTALRGKFKGTHVESAPLCQWMPCAEACVMEEPGEDEMSPMSAARRPERGPARRDDGRARRPVCKIFAYLAETYLVAPVPLALRWRRGSAPPAGPPAAARGASSPEEEPRIPTMTIDWDEAGALKVDWDETGAPEASPETFLDASSLPGSGTPVKGVPPPVVDAGDPVTDEEALEILEIRERAGGGGEARARVDALDADALQGVPLDAGESPALISKGGAAGADGMPPSRLGDGMACGGFDSVRCDAAACVGPGDAGATSCLSSTLDDAFAVPSRTAACLFGLDRLEDEAPRVKVPAARPAVAEEAAPVDDGDLVVPEMGEWVESLVGDLDACLAREDAEPLASGPGRGATASPRLSLASLASRGISRASFAGAAGHEPPHALQRQLQDDARGAGRRERQGARAAVAYLRAEMLSKKERTVMTTIAERLQGELEAPEEPPGAAPYVAAWAGVLCVVLYCFYDLLTTGSQFGRKKTRLWLEAVTFSLVLYFVFIKPIVVLLISVIMPSFVASSVDKTRSPLDHPRYPFETPLPESSVFYLLRWHPELNGTRLADHVAAEASGAPRSARDGLTDARVAEIHGAAIPRTSAAAVVVALLALLFGLHEDIQDTIIEEVFTFLPLASGFVAERTPGLESAGEDVGAAFGMVVVGALVYVAWKAYHACGKATTRAAAALPRRKSDASGPAFRWPEDKAPPPDVAGEDEKSPEDAVALVLFDGGGDGDRVEAARPDDDEAAAERPDDAASDGEFLDDEEVFLDADVQRADEAGAADAEERGAEAAARDDHEAGDAEERGADAAARSDEAGAADAEERGADAAARSDEEAPRARGRSATRGEGRSRSRSRSKSRSRSRRPGHGAMHRAPYVVKAKGAVVRDGVALDSDKVTRLAAGTEVVVTYAKQLPDKKTRYLIVKPVVGWVSRGAVAEARPARDDDDR